MAGPSAVRAASTSGSRSLVALRPQRQRLEDPDQVADRDALVEQRLEHPLHLAEAELGGRELLDDDRVACA